MRNGNRTHVCRECGVATADVQLFKLELDSGGVRGYWHAACFKKVQRRIIVAARKWILSSKG